MSQHRTIDGRSVVLSFGYADSSYLLEVFDKKGRRTMSLPFSLAEGRFLIDSMNGSCIDTIPEHLSKHAARRDKLDDATKAVPHVS